MKKKITTVLTVVTAVLISFTIGQAQTFNYTGSLQKLKVPSCADSAVITTYGAQGGTGVYGPGGLGAKITGTFAVTGGHTLDIVVGQQGNGSLSGPYYAGSGGGGSYVWDSATPAIPMIIAGGGGGIAYNSTPGAGSADSIPTTVNGSGSGAGGVGGNGGQGGGGANYGNSATGGGGAGWYSNGDSGTYAVVAYGGQDPANGSAGGLGGSPGAPGGYGGGGGTAGNSGAGGGGGGYNGGGGGNRWNSSLTAWGAGEGGGSYNAGYNQSNTGAFQSGNGMVVVTFITIVPKVSPLAGPDSVCQGSTYTFSCASFVGETYTWTVPSGATIISGQGTDSAHITFASTSGLIKVIGTSGCGNDSDSVSVIVNPLPVLSISAGKDTLCVSAKKDTLIGLPAGGTFSGAGVSNGNFNPSVAGTGTHSVTYTYTNAMGCTNTDSITLVVNACTGINEINAFDNVNIYPNPFSQSLTINVKENMEVTMYDMLGNKMGTWNVKQGTHEINTQAIPAGVYSLQVKSNTDVVTRKFVKVN